MRGENSATPVFVYCAVGGRGGPVQSILALRDGLSRYRYAWLAGAWSEAMLPKVRRGVAGEVSEIVQVTRPRGLRTPTAVRQLGRELRRLRDERVVVHANGLTELTLLLPILARTRLPAVAWVHNYEIPRKARLLRMARSMVPDTLQVAAVSAQAADLARVLLGDGPEATIVPNPLSGSVLGSLARPPSGGRLRIGYLGTARRYKGFDYLVRTIERTHGHEFDWLIACNPYAHDRESWDRLTALEGRGVEVVGRVMDVTEVYSRCDAVFVPSRSESFCRVAAEAMANGLFVVASDLEPLREFEALGDTISFFPVGQVDAGLARLREVARLSPDERAARGSRAAHRARAAFSVETTAARLEDLYDRALARRERRRTVGRSV